MQAATVLAEVAAPASDPSSARYARCIKISKRVRWDIDRDVIRGRDFDFNRTFLPTGLSKVDELEFLSADERRTLSQVQGRSYVYLFGLVERFIAAKVLQISASHSLGDQTALEAMVRFSDEELKHQELFRRLEMLLAKSMPAGYEMLAEPNAIARFVLAKKSWAVLALISHIELFVQAHYEQSIAPSQDLCPLWKDVFMFHWREECQHAVLDELEWQAEHARIDAAERDTAVGDLIELVGAVDGLLQAQAGADARYYSTLIEGSTNTERFAPEQRARIGATLLKAYRWQYIVSGVQHPRFSELLAGMTTPAQMQRIVTALTPILHS